MTQTNRRPMGGGEYIPQIESASRTQSSEITEVSHSREKGALLKGHERVVEEPTNERLGDDRPDLSAYQDLDPEEDGYAEKIHLKQILEKYSPENIRTFDTTQVLSVFT